MARGCRVSSPRKTSLRGPPTIAAAAESGKIGITITAAETAVTTWIDGTVETGGALTTEIGETAATAIGAVEAATRGTMIGDRMGDAKRGTARPLLTSEGGHVPKGAKIGPVPPDRCNLSTRLQDCTRECFESVYEGLISIKMKRRIASNARLKGMKVPLVYHLLRFV